MASITKQPKEVQERHRAMLLELLKQPGNRECADCRGRNPTWASTNLGIFVCIRCSGLHRQVGTHVTKVKSCTMDLWDPEQIAFMARMGNARARLVWEAQLSADYGKPSESERDDMVLEWIRAKYERKRYMAMDPEAVLRAAGPAPAVGSLSTKRATGGPLRTRTAGGGGPTGAAAPVGSPAASASGFSFAQAANAPAGGAPAFSFVASGPTSPSSSTTPAPASPPPSFASPQTGFDFGAGGFNFGAPPASGFTDAPAAGGFDFASAAPSSPGFAFTGAPAPAVATPTATGAHVLDSLFKAAPASAVDVFGMPAPATVSSSTNAVAPREAPLGFMVGTATEVPAAAVPTASAPPTFPAPVKADPFAVLAQPFESPSHAPAPFSTPASSFASPAAAFEPAAPAPPVAAPFSVPAAAPSGGVTEDTAAMQRMLEQLQAQQALLMQQMHQLQLQSA